MEQDEEKKKRKKLKLPFSAPLGWLALHISIILALGLGPSIVRSSFETKEEEADWIVFFGSMSFLITAISYFYTSYQDPGFILPSRTESHYFMGESKEMKARLQPYEKICEICQVIQVSFSI
jgi:hypothetical protein